MTIERKATGILIYELVGEHLAKEFFIGYTLKEAKAEFQNILNQERD